MADPFTCAQLMLLSNSSSTRPTVHTLSPRTMYRPKGTSCESSGSSGVRITRSRAPERTCRRRWSEEGFSECRFDLVAYQVSQLVVALKLPDENPRVHRHNQHLLYAAVRIQAVSSGLHWGRRGLDRGTHL